MKIARIDKNKLFIKGSLTEGVGNISLSRNGDLTVPELIESNELSNLSINKNSIICKEFIESSEVFNV